MRRRIQTYLVIPFVLAALSVNGQFLKLDSTERKILDEIKTVAPHYMIQNKENIIKEIEDVCRIKIDEVNIKLGDVDYAGLYEGVKDGVFSDTIVIDTNYFFYTYSALSFNSPLNEELSRKLVFLTSARGTLIHEIGHDYTYQKMYELLHKGTLHKSHAKSLKNGMYGKRDTKDLLRIRVALINEGIARYFEDEMKELPQEYISEWPIRKEDFYLSPFGDPVYSHGFILLKPILDEFGVEKGIEKILENLIITKKELLKPGDYIKRILNSE